MAFQRGEDSVEAFSGALMHAEFQAHILKFINSYVESSKKAAQKSRGRRR